MDKIRKDRHQSQTSYDMTTSRATSRVNSRVNKLRYSWYSYYDVENCSFGCLLGIQKIFAEPWISLVGFMQTFLGSKSFSKLWTNRELRVSVFFLRFSLRISLHLVEAFYYCHLSFLCFRFAALRSDHLLLADLQTRPSNQSIRTAWSQTTPDEIRPQIRPQLTIVRPDHHQIRLSEQTFTARPDYQIRSPHQTTDHHPWLLNFQSAQDAQPLEVVQVRCILYGLGQGGYIELWMNLTKHTSHTLSAWRLRNSSFGLT